MSDALASELPPLRRLDDFGGYRLAGVMLRLFTSKGYRTRLKGFIVAGMNCLAGHPSGDPNFPFNPTYERCGLCGDVARGNAAVYVGGERVRLCHDTRQFTCYVRWTVYGERPT